MKVCNSGGFCTTSNMLAGLEWCTNNKEILNISVISMSLGDNGEYNSTNCPADYADQPGLAAAYAEGIFLAAASGNNHYTSGISYPACNENVTSAGAVNKNDDITYNRGGDILTLLAPGVSITSSYHNGGTATMSGTSMSTPHIAGAAAILQQYSKMNGNTINQQQIETALNNTGTSLYDSSSEKTYSRISVYEAVKSLSDNLGPSINIASPANLTYNTNISLSLSYVAGDINGICSEWYTINNGENNIISGDTTFNTTEGSQVLNIYANDSSGNENFVSVCFTTDLTDPSVGLNTQNDSYTRNPVTLNFTLTEENADSCSLYGSWMGWHLNETKPASENSFSVNLEDGTYIWNVKCNDTAGNQAFADENYTINVDSIQPGITIISPENITYSVNESLEFNYSVIDNNLDVCWYDIGGGNVTLDNCENLTFNTTEGPHNIKLYANDSAGNENHAEISFTTDITSPEVNLDQPSDGTFLSTSSATLNFTLTEENADSCSLYGSWGGWHLNETKPASENSFSVNLEDGTYTWNIECNDTAGNKAFSNTNYTFIIDSEIPEITIVSPENITYPTNASLELSFSAIDSNLDSCWYNLNNGNNIQITDCSNTTFDALNDQGNYIHIFSNDSAGNENHAEISFTTDLTPPAIILSLPSNNTLLEPPINFTYTVQDIGVANCSLVINNAINSTDTSIITYTTQQFNSLTLTDNTYYWNINCTDNVNQQDNSEERKLIVCTENWNCTEWNGCSDSQQTRSCTELNSCGTTYSKPSESQSCSSSSDSDSDSGSSDESGSGAASSSSISSDDQEDNDETNPSITLPETGKTNLPEENKEEQTEAEEILVEASEESTLTKALNILKGIKEWIIQPKQTANIISTHAIDTAKNNKITLASFIFIIFVMTFTHFYFFKKYKISLIKKVKEKINIPKPNIIIPSKVKNLKAKFKGIRRNIKESSKPKVIKPVKKVHKSNFLKKFNPFNSYKDLLRKK